MSKIKAIIIDNKADCIELLQQELNQHCSSIDVIGTCQSFSDAYLQINEKKPDLVFVDIFHDKHTSFDLLDLFDPIFFKVIFVTRHDKFAVKAFKYSALDYIIKPFTSLDIVTAIKLAKKNITTPVNFSLLKEQMSSQTIIPKLAVSTNQKIELVNICDIIYFEADKSYTALHTKETKHVISKNIKELELLLEDQNFYRPHKSYLININQIKSYDIKDGGSIAMEGKTVIPISQRKKQAFLEMMASLYKR